MEKISIKNLEHKSSVTFVKKVGTSRLLVSKGETWNILTAL